MKKATLFLFVILPSCFLSAQTNKGDQFVSALFNSRISNRYGIYTGSFEGLYQRFIFKNISVGAGMEFSFDRIRSLETVYHNQSFYIKPEIRYYFLDGKIMKGKIQPYAYANAGFGVGYHSGFADKYRMEPFKMEAGVGVNWFLTDHLALESRIGIKGKIVKGYNPSLTGLDFKIGIRYSIPSGKKKINPKEN
jgi:hypothetical protein